MLHGRGEQYKFTKEYLDLRNTGLLDITDLTAQEKIDADLEDEEPGSKWNESVYKFYNMPIPADRSSKEIDRRDVYSNLGEKTR